MYTKNWFGRVYGWAQALAFGSLLVGILIESRSAIADDFDPPDCGATAPPPADLMIASAAQPLPSQSLVPSQLLSSQGLSPQATSPSSGRTSAAVGAPAKNIDAYMIPPRAEPIIDLDHLLFGAGANRWDERGGGHGGGHGDGGVGLFTGPSRAHRSLVLRTYQFLIRAFENPIEKLGLQNHASQNDWANRLNFDDNLPLSGRSIWKLDTEAVLDGDDPEDRADAAPNAIPQPDDSLDTTFYLPGPPALRPAALAADSPLRDDGNGSSGAEIREMLFEDLSYAPAYTRDAVYSDAFLDSGRLTSAAQLADDGTGGHLGVLLTEHPIDPGATAPNTRAQQNVSAALGYQRFLDAQQRQQIILEVGGRSLTYGTETPCGAVGVRYQQALSDHLTLRLDTFGALNEARGLGCGGRLEFRVEF